MTPEDNAVPNVIARPPLIVLVTVLAALLLDYMLPRNYFATMAPLFRYVSGGIALAAGLVMLGSAASRFREEGTNIPTWEPALALVTDGIYARTRNPIYVAFIWVLIGLSLLFTSGWLLNLLIPFALVMHFGVVLPEEQYLQQRFGAAYTGYKARVPRYFWIF